MTSGGDSSAMDDAGPESDSGSNTDASGSSGGADANDSDGAGSSSGADTGGSSGSSSGVDASDGSGSSGGADAGASSGSSSGGAGSDASSSSSGASGSSGGSGSSGSSGADASDGSTACTSDGQCTAGQVCCSGSCYPGNCCIIGGAPSGCSGASVSCAPSTQGETTGGGVCTTCLAVSGSSPIYTVDPVRGSDSQGTGNTSASPTCALQTVTRALQVIGASPQPNTSIDLVGSASGVTVQGVASGTPPAGQERYPLTIPANVTVTTSGGPVTIEVAAAATSGFVLAGNASAIAGGAGATLVIDSKNRAAAEGVLVLSTNASLSSVTIQHFSAEGILVGNTTTASALSVGPGTQVINNGADGMLVRGVSTATVTGAANAPVVFNDNGTHGVRVINEGVISMTGSVGANPPSSSTVVFQGNTTAGIWVQTTSTTQSTITGVSSTGSTAGNGIRIIPGSNVQVRSCWLLGNSQGNGIDIENNGGTIDTVANIDLGTMGNPGDNVVQSASGNNPNGRAGICLRLPPGGASVTLSAQGNVFRGVNCATTAGVLVTVGNRGCGGGADVGGTITATATPTGNEIDVTTCTVP